MNGHLRTMGIKCKIKAGHVRPGTDNDGPYGPYGPYRLKPLVDVGSQGQPAATDHRRGASTGRRGRRLAAFLADDSHQGAL